MNVPAFCENCGAVFPSGLFVQGVGVTLSHNATSCPGCGQMAWLIDGEFTIIGNTLEILSAPALTVEILRRIVSSQVQARQSHQEPPDLASQLAEVDPEAAARLKELGVPSHLLVFILIVAILLKSCGLTTTVDVNRLIDQLGSGAPVADLANSTSGSHDVQDSKASEQGRDTDSARTGTKKERPGSRHPKPRSKPIG